MSRDRGRYLRPVVPKDGEPVRVAIDATLREAAKKSNMEKKRSGTVRERHVKDIFRAH